MILRVLLALDAVQLHLSHERGARCDLPPPSPTDKHAVGEISGSEMRENLHNNERESTPVEEGDDVSVRCCYGGTFS